MSRTITLFTTAALLASAFPAGCSTTNRGGGREVLTDPLIDIVKGSSTADLVAVFGEPQRIQPHESDPNVEVWTYDIRKSQTDMVGVGTQEIPYIDPITGQERMLIEPLYKPQTTTHTQQINVFVVNEKVIGWKVDQNVDRNIVD